MVFECKKLEYKSTILLICFHGCEPWCLTLREKHGLKSFEYRILRRIFGRNWDEAAGVWRELINSGSFPD
jgi:hypothetical protein